MDYSVGRQNMALQNCIPKSNYNYNTNDYLVINCFFNKHIITITKTPNDLTSLGVYFILIKTRERKRENPSRPKQSSPFKIRVKNSYKTNYYDKIIFTIMQAF